MLSIAKFTHHRDPDAIANILRQDLQPLGIEKLSVEVKINDSRLDIQIRTNSAIDKEKLLTLVRNQIQNLHVESVAKFRIHYWRNDEERQEQHLLWTEQFMVEQSNPSLQSSDLLAEEIGTRLPEPQLSKQSVLQRAIAKIYQKNQLVPINNEPVVDPHAPKIDLNKLPNLALAPHQSSRSRHSHRHSQVNYWQLMTIGLSIVLLGLGIGVTVRALTNKNTIDSNSLATSPSPQATMSIKNSAPVKANQPNEKLLKTPINGNSGADQLLNIDTEIPQEERLITLDKFNRIQKGMSIAQVEKIFGVSGKVIAENSSGESIGRVYSWQNPEGSNAIIEFKDGQVVAKAQAGL
ncbi:hypothetical protein [Pseudanabaena mucicola]|uniref:Uncharacterized protein n=1 Tax=Pseudanabaena mucicola FACHB-723 TaxID=2692860 RepID=A0ABR7ZXH5_9CYAN|nr:hypothetical protein [Pseudanabaena mucicola]MBD2188552.1 hypothetical protein [Pseudanabaena mucicola FACHB-723]